MKKFTLLIFAILCTSFAWSQTKITGTVKDSANEPLPGASVLVKGTSNGTATDFNGNFTLNAPSNATLVVSFAGFATQEIAVNGKSNISVTLKEGMELDEVVVTGNRAKPRTILDSPVPIDNIGVEELTSGGQPIIEQMLTFKVPSFNSQNQAISDATAHYDPADLRGLGPSRTLVLINGKRKNQSAQVYLNRTPGKGEVGIDLKSIPTAAIERVEVLRDGASAQYGSDAIAGVLNFVLKKNAEYSVFSARSGITSQGDGFNFATDFNTGFKIAEKGYVNLTLGYFNQEITNRAGSPGVSDLPGTPDPEDYENDTYSDGSLNPAFTHDTNFYNSNIAGWRQWATENPRLGMKVGQPELEKVDLFVNAGYPITENTEFYTTHGYTYRTGKSFAYYRAPYWRRDVAKAGFLVPTTTIDADNDGTASQAEFDAGYVTSNFIGYQPTFETKIIDHFNLVGLDMDLGNDWNADLSVTFGKNSVDYTVNNSVNRDYLAEHGTSPRSFNPGGYSLSNVIGNLDVTKLVNEDVSLALGLEWKREQFDAFEGDPISYYGGGSDSFAGIKPEEAGTWNRNNFAAYAQVDYDITEDLLLGVAGRYEDFSDFGDNFSWKINGRYKLGDKGAIRASYSTGFRAPTLHQRHLTNSQYIIVSGSNEPLLQGTLANNSAAVQNLGVPNLFAETSKNFSAGLTYKFDRNFSASLDFYQIRVDDRVLFSSQIGSDNDDDTTNPVEQILADNGVVAVQFFINAGDTKTTGADFVLNYKNLELGENSRLHANLAANFNTTTIDAINTPEVIANAGYNIFDRQEQGLITNSRPKSKFILGLDMETPKVDVGLYNTLFGKVTVTAPSDGFDANGVEIADGTDQDLGSKIVTDLSVTYKFTDKLRLTGTINNIFDVYPDPTDPATNTAQAGTRFIYSSEVQQLGQLGTNFNIGLNYRF